MLKIVTIIAIIFCLSLSTALSFSGNGSGTEADPYQITTVEQLQEMNDDLDAHYILMNDIDASETKEWNVGDHDNDPDTPDSAMGFEPVGLNREYYSKFNGFFNGKNFTIRNLFINRPSQSAIGIFSGICYNSVANIKVDNANITGNSATGILTGIIMWGSLKNCSVSGKVLASSSTGGLVGSTKYGFHIDDCYAECDVIGLGEYTGGIIGYLSCNDDFELTNCSFHGSIVGREHTGGLVGRIHFDIEGNNKKGNITFCNSVGNVFGESNTGGLIGSSFQWGGSGDFISSISINNCISLCTVYGKEYTGGLIGIFESNDHGFTIEKNFFEGDVTGSSYCGGLIGKSWSFYYSGSIKECYTKGKVSGNEYVGGFIGSFAGASWGSYSISTCFSNADVIPLSDSSSAFGGFCGGCYQNEIYASYSTGKVNGYSKIGGFCGVKDNNSEISHCYFDKETSGIDSSVAGIPKTTAEMMLRDTYENWSDYYFNQYWCMAEHETYPQLQYFVDCDTLVSVPEIRNETEISIYPNPATDVIKISSNEFIDRIKIINLLGNVVKEIKPEGFARECTIYVGDLSGSLYTLITECERKILTRQIIIY